MTTTRLDDQNPRREGINVQQRQSRTFKQQALRLPIEPHPPLYPCFVVPLPLPPLPRTPVAARTVDEFHPSELEKPEILGYGSGGKVYKVRHRRTQSHYALKVVHGDHDISIRRHIVYEMEILRRTNFAYVVKCHGIYDWDGEIQFVLEYMDGGSLDMCGRQMPEPFLAVVAGQVLQGLKYLHANKIVHRDIKPSNLFLNIGHQIKIVDFGVSQILSKSQTSV